jgi:hypothetical protein
MTKNWRRKKYSWNFYISFFDPKLQFAYPQDPSYRRSLQTSKENIQHIKKWNWFFFFCESFLPSWMRIRIRNSAFKGRDWIIFACLGTSSACKSAWRDCSPATDLSVAQRTVLWHSPVRSRQSLCQATNKNVKIYFHRNYFETGLCSGYRPEPLNDNKT